MPILKTVALLGLLVALPAEAATSKKVMQSNVEALKSAVDTLWNQRDTSALESAYQLTPEAAEAQKQFYEANVADFPDIKVTLTDVRAADDKVYYEWTSTGTHAQLGKTVEVSGLGVARMADGKIVEDRINYDTLGLFQQLGVDPFEPSAAGNAATLQMVAEKVYNERDAEAVKEAVAGFMTTVNGGEAAAFDGAQIVENLGTTWSEYKLSLHEAIARGDWVSMRWTAKGKLAEQEDREVTLTGTVTVRFEDGKPVEGWNHFDTMPMMPPMKK